MAIIRKETREDTGCIRHVLEQAFGRSSEADLVDALRQSEALLVSLLAVEEDQVVGHIAFSPVSIEPSHWTFGALGLAPLAVLPARQRRGVGAELVRCGLDECRRAGHRAVFVLGSPRFYQRFGFATTLPRGLRCSFEVAAELFMVTELVPAALAECTGTVRYRPEFDTASTKPPNTRIGY